MKKKDFKEYVEDGIARGKNFMVVRIEGEVFPGAEIKIDPAVNFADKLKYYLTAFNEDMQMISTPADKVVRITDVLMTSNLNDLSWFAY